VAVPDPDLGERMCACVIPRLGHALRLDELIAFLDAREIARFKLPERLVLMERFPLSTRGTVSKKALVAQITAPLGS
jgi:2,3-dihydroxybenzoate-AMP ligase